MGLCNGKTESVCAETTNCVININSLTSLKNIDWSRNEIKIQQLEKEHRCSYGLFGYMSCNDKCDSICRHHMQEPCTNMFSTFRCPFSFCAKKKKQKQLDSNFYFDHRKLTASIYIFSKIKKLSLEIILWFSLESFLGYFPDGLSYWGSLIREICDIKERNKAGSGRRREIVFLDLETIFHLGGG